ncbi:YheC/YheD family endospore coat-associated protein [Priestia abyssalis]|uniref:YheC/YheD family endospore coat-associated protein n=1 Tax=Priestia abyssalis TaxID=1221450 RepID=UPI001116179B|nr:YheC/YheD family protein [Priestia abyssalis]
MVTVGMLSHRNNPETVFKSYAYAAAAKMEGVNFYFFSPGRVNFKNRTIRGWVYENGQWLEKSMPFPDVIYNASPPMTEKQEKIIDKLSAAIPFTSHPIGNKIYVHQKIKRAKTFAQYLIPSMEISKVEDVFEFLNSHQDIVMKPLNGHKGEDILFVQKKSETFIVRKDERQIMNAPELKDLIERLIKDEGYLIQAYIPSKTRAGFSYNLRLHVQKDGAGEWNLTTIFPCITLQGIVANLNSDGYTIMFDDFLKQEFGDDAYNVKRYLEQFAIHFSEHFDGLYDEPLDELGIDVGLDSNQKIWIFEVNWRPGTPPTFSLELDVAKQMIRYARYLAETASRQ